MGSFSHFYEVLSKITNGDSKSSETLPKIPPLPNFKCDALPDTPEYRIHCAQLRKQKEDFSRDMVDYTAKMDKIYKKSENVVTNSTQGYRIKSFGFIVSTWISKDELNIKLKLKEPKIKVIVIMKRCLKRKFRMEIVNTDYEVVKWLYIKTPWNVMAKDLQIVKNSEEDDDSIIVKGPVMNRHACAVLP